MSASDGLRSIRAKIERADHHITELEQQFTAFCETDSYGTSFQQDAQTGEKVFRVKIRSEIPHDFSCIIGDAVHNLRSALDHLIWQLAVVSKANPGRQHEFPIRKTRSEYKAKLSRVVQGFPPGAVKLIREAKPYKRRSRRDNHLWLIHHLDILDKHRHLVIGMAAPWRTTLGRPPEAEIRRQWPADEFNSISAWELGGRLRMMKEGDELIRISGAPDKFPMENDIKVAFQIAFAKPKIVKGYPVVPFLHQASGLIDNFINQFVPFL